jgi:BMFP domain-containing protein YqiC
MQNNNKIFSDLSKLAGSAAGGVMDMKREMESMAAAHVEKVLKNMDLVTKEEFATTQAMLTKARLQQEELKKRVEALELCINELTSGKKSTK